MKLTDANRLTILFPEIASEFDFEKNKGIELNNLSVGSGLKIHWICRFNPLHKWIISVNDRTGTHKNGCPYCGNKKVDSTNSLLTLYPTLCLEWDYGENIISPDKVVPFSHKYANWICQLNPKHKWKCKIQDRVLKNSGCPYCSGHKCDSTNSLLTLNSKLCEEWDYTLNKISPNDVTTGSGINVHWICKNNSNHKWKTSVRTRARATNGCPYCGGFSCDFEHSIKNLNPSLCEEWDYEKNGTLSPDSISINSGKKINWICKNDTTHKWKSAVYSRTNGSGCPYCSGRLVSKSNSLSILCPELINQWHPILNGDLTPDKVTFKTHKKAWWICEKNHVWNTAIYNRTSGKGCSICKESHGEKKTALILESLQVNFKRQYKFDDCKYKQNLPFDFAIFNNGKLVALIEYQGEYHYQIFDHAGGLPTLEINQLRDQIKLNYCIQKGITLLRIPYWDKNRLEQIVSNFLRVVI